MNVNHGPDPPKEDLGDCFHLSARARSPAQDPDGYAGPAERMWDRECSTSIWQREETRQTVGSHLRHQETGSFPFQRGQTWVWVMSGRSQQYRP